MSIIFLVHLFQVFHYKGYYLYLFMLGIVLEVFGYWTRVVAIKQPDNVGAVAISYLLITVAPSFIAATAYMTYGRIIYWVAPVEKRAARYTWVPTRWVTTIFVSLDIIAFAISCIGIFVYIANQSKSDLDDAQKREVPYQVLKVAFFWQIAVFFLFTLASFRFMFASNSFKYDWPQGSSKWRKIAWVNNGTMFIITLRSLYRCLSFTINHGDNYLRNSEWTFYMFDFVPVIAVLIILAIVHPANNIPESYTTIRHGYKKEGFKLPSIKEVSEEEEDEPVAGYKKVTLVPPTNNASSSKNQTRADGSPVTFNDPWAHRPSPTAEKF